MLLPKVNGKYRKNCRENACILLQPGNDNRNLTLENSTVYGTHSGMQLNPNSQTQVTGGVYEGVCHGGIYFSNMGGSALVQDAKISNARYRGDYKNCFDYDSGLYHNAGLYVGGINADGIAAYLENCNINGSTGNAMVFSSTEGAQNSALYLSNCHVTGGSIRIDDDSHKLYIGKACHVEPTSNRPNCVLETAEVYWCMPETTVEE